MNLLFWTWCEEVIFVRDLSQTTIDPGVVSSDHFMHKGNSQYASPAHSHKHIIHLNVYWEKSQYCNRTKLSGYQAIITIESCEFGILCHYFFSKCLNYSFTWAWRKRAKIVINRTDYCNGLCIYLIIILLVRYSQLTSNTYVIFTVYALDFYQIWNWKHQKWLTTYGQ